MLTKKTFVRKQKRNISTLLHTKLNMYTRALATYGDETGTEKMAYIFDVCRTHLEKTSQLYMH